MVNKNVSKVNSYPSITREIMAVLAIIAFSVFIRIIFYTGVSGSDEVLYTNSAIKIANGDWSLPENVASLRYGFTIPIAMFVRIFGPSELVVNLWTFLCSIGEIALVFIFARLAWGLRAAILSSIVIALIPIHVHISGRILTDPPLAFFITLSFLLLFLSEKRRSSLLCFSAGLAVGFTFWIKTPVLIYAAIFLIYMLILRTLKVKWLWLFVGMIVMIVLNCILFWTISGNFLHIFEVIGSTMSEKFFTRKEYIDTPWYYFKYMFLDGRHTGIMPYLALAGLVMVGRKLIRASSLDTTETYLVIWSLGLIFLFSFLIVSITPFRFIMKQTNYMLIFMAPLSLLAGYFLMRIKGIALGIILLSLFIGGIVLSGIEQQVIRVFTSNSKAAVIFAKQNPNVPVYGIKNAVNVSNFMQLINEKEKIKPISELNRLIISEESKAFGFAIIDWETIDWAISWGDNYGIVQPKDIPKCWQKIGVLQPIGFGIGEKILSFLIFSAGWFPESISQKIISYCNPYLRPKPAEIYQIPPHDVQP